MGVSQFCWVVIWPESPVQRTAMMSTFQKTVRSCYTPSLWSTLEGTFPFFCILWTESSDVERACGLFISILQVYRQRSSGVLSVDLLSFDGRGAGGEVVGECSSVINTLIERGVAVRNNRKWEEPPSLSINLGSGDCLDVTVPTAEHPWDFHVQLVRLMLCSLSRMLGRIVF